jgi:hypothetical protein
VAVIGSVSSSILGSQVLPVAFRSLLFSALCFSFTDPGEEEVRESEKEQMEKKKKKRQ